ncbi:MAG TPA: ABC transporter permease [Candidatus Polarisedimenticolia bacterium]|jgi:ABC-type transport system involved in multi-copper enzyme maturation permease subunit
MRTLAIAANTFREAIRDRILYLLLAFAILMIVSSRILSYLTVGAEEKIVKDIGLAAISLFGVATAIFVGVGLVFKEIEKRTVYTLVSKPIRRSQFILGKYLGLVMVLAVNVAVMTTVFYLLLAFKGWMDIALTSAIVLIFVELMLVTAFAILFSSFSTPILSSLFTVTVYVIGHLSWGLLLLADRIEGGAGRALCRLLYRGLPNLEALNVKGMVVHGLEVPPAQVLFASVYGLSYTLIVLALAVLVFRRRDFL